MNQLTTWLPAALVALFSFGFWGFFSKLTLLHVDSKSALVYQTLGVLIVGLFTFYMLNYKPATNVRGISFGILTGVAYGIGCLFYLIAADKGKVTTVVTMTALYPLITIILSYLVLHETISIKQYAGIALALAAIYLMA